MDWNDAWEVAGEALTNDQETIFELSFRLAQLKAENKRLRGLQHHQHTYCAYCGEEFPADVEGAVDNVEAHIFACEKHPITYIKKILKNEVWADMTLGTVEEIRLFKLLNWMDDKALGGE